MAKLLKLRRGTTSQHSSFTGAEGEVTVDTTKDTLVVHDGSTAGGTPLAKESDNLSLIDEDNMSTNSATRPPSQQSVKAYADTKSSPPASAGTVGASETCQVDSNKDIAGFRNITLTGELDAATGDFSGDVDVDGTLEADAITVNGTALNTVIAGVVVTNATNAQNATSAVDSTNSTHVFVTDNESTNENNLIPFIEDASSDGNVGLESDGDFHYNPSSGQLTVPAVSTTGNITVAGNLTVNGTTTTVASTNTTITDNLLELNSGASSNANDAGILIERGSTGDNAIIAWDESADKFTVGTTTGTASSTGNISISTGTIVANVEGNVTGNTSGSSGSCTGNAATATQATNADTVDNLHAASFLRADASDTATGNITLTSAGQYPFNINGSNDGKIVLQGSNSPYIYFREGTSDKAYIQWTTDGVFTLYNSERSKGLSLGNTLSWDGGTVWTSANDGSGSGLDADTLDGVSSGSFLRGDAADIAYGDISFQGGAGAVSIAGNSDIRLDNGTWTGNAYGKIQHHSDYLYICGGTNGIIFREDGTNRWQVGPSGHFYPSADNSYNVGTGSYRVANVYAYYFHDIKGDVRSIPAAAKSSAYTMVGGDRGKAIYTSSGGVTIPQNTMTAGDAVTIINNSGSDQTITQASGVTLYNTADAATGNRTLAGRGMATVWFASANICYISGAGLS